MSVQRDYAPSPGTAKGTGRAGRGAFRAFVPRLLDEPWDGARIVAASVACCDLTGLADLVEATSGDDTVETINGVLDDLITAAEGHGGDVISIGGHSLCVLFTGDGRQGRGINTVHAMHELLADSSNSPVTMSAGIASGLVHLITTGDDPLQLFALGPTVTRALELAAQAGSGQTRSETVDRSTIETHGKAVAWPASHFLASPLRGAIEAGSTGAAFVPATVGVGVFSGVDRALQRNPTRAMQQVALVLETVERVAAEFGITLLGNEVGKDGGRLLLTTDVPAATDDGEERMILAAKAALGAEPPFALRFGIATGTVLAGGLGAGARRAYTVVGTTVDLAARLAASASPGEVLTTHRAIDRAITRYRISEWEPVTFQGSDAAVVPVVVGDELTATDHNGRGGFVGRSEDRGILVRHLERLASGRGGVVDVSGPAGVGKTRLVAEALRDRDVAEVMVQCEEYRRSIPYGAASRLLRGAMGIGEDVDPKRVGVLLKAKIRDLTPYLEPWLPLLAEVIDARVARTRHVDRLDGSFRREKAHWAVSQLAVWLTREPIVVRIEDAHWMDAASADLLSYVLARGSDLPWLVVSARRPQGTGWIPPDWLDAVSVDLDPLSPGASLALLTELTKDTSATKKRTREMIERAGGNPLFLERLAAKARSRNALPKTINAEIKAELDGLDPAARTLLGGAAVLGGRFDPDLAADVLGAADWEALDVLIETEPGGQLRFRQALVAEAMYRAVPARRRRDLHLQTGAALATRGAGPELLSLHFDRGGDDESTWRYGLAAGKQAFARNAPVEAAAMVGPALEAATRLSVKATDLAEAAELLADALLWAGSFDDADKAYLSAAGNLTTKGDKVRILRKRSLVREDRGQYPAALRMITAALGELPKRPGPGERAVLEVAYARVRYKQGHHRDVIERCDAAIPLAEKAGEHSTLAHAHFLRGRARSHRDPASGTDDVKLALGLFKKAGDHLLQAEVVNVLAAEAHRGGRWDEAVAFQLRNAEQRDLAGDTVGAARAAHQRAVVLLDQGMLDEAEAELERVRAIFQTANQPSRAAEATMRLASVAAWLGESDIALGTLEVTLAQFEDAGLERLVAVNRLVQAETHLLGGDVEGAFAAAEKAIELAEDAEDVDLPLVGLARVRGVALIWLGSGQEGHIQLMEALEQAQSLGALFEEALICDALGTLYGDRDAADRRTAIMLDLGVVKLPPFLTIG